jgi:hypothetical protein
MPPRRTAADAPACGDPFAALPHALALAIFSRLTVEQRLRCIEVCRGWRATLADHAAWMQLDLTRADGSACSEALLRAATSRAGGQLRSLRLTYRRAMQAGVCAVAAANAATLQELRLTAPADAFAEERCGIRDSEELLRAAPQLRVLEADAFCVAAHAHQVLRNEPPFGPLRVQHLEAYHGENADAIIALAADMAAHEWLAGVSLHDVPLGAPDALDAVVDAALERRLSAVTFRFCEISPASAPALSRLLAGNALAELCIMTDFRYLLLDAPAAVLLANALRANTTLTSLSLVGGLWNDDAAAAELLRALTAHPRLRLLDVSGHRPPYAGFDGSQEADLPEAGAALSALLANAPALQTLDIGWCGLGDAQMGPVVEALRHNTHLTKLDCRANAMSEAFARNELLPAVRANTSLRELAAAAIIGADEGAAAREAEALVAARSQPS